jgi:hypothetical protein
MFKMLSDWPGPGNVFVPIDTVIDAASPEWAGVPMPMTAMALDAEAADYLARCYPHSLHELRAGPGVVIRKLINIGDEQ